MTEQLFSALKLTETLAEGTMKVYEPPSGQGLDRRNDMAISFLHSKPWPECSRNDMARAISFLRSKPWPEGSP